jgi:hypothetical protein
MEMHVQHLHGNACAHTHLIHALLIYAHLRARVMRVLRDPTRSTRVTQPMKPKWTQRMKPK